MGQPHTLHQLHQQQQQQKQDTMRANVSLSDEDADDENLFPLSRSMNSMSLDDDHYSNNNDHDHDTNSMSTSTSSSVVQNETSSPHLSSHHMELDADERRGDSPSTLSSDGAARSPKTEVNLANGYGVNQSNQSMPTRYALRETGKIGGVVDNWGWFDDESTEGSRKSRKQRLLDFSAMEILPLNDMNKEKADGGMVTAPNYVLEESLSSQKLWKHTAGNRPPQPVEERAMFERMWSQNFDKSEVEYNIPQEVLKATSPIAISPFTDTDYGEDNDIETFSLTAFHALSNRLSSTNHNQIHLVKAAEADAMEASIHNWTRGNKQQRGDERSALSKKEAEKFTVFMKGDNVFGTTVSKSFPLPGTNQMETLSVSIDKYRVIQQVKNGFRYAQYLVVVCIGDFRNTIGVWKRFSDFEKLSRMVATEQEGYCLSSEDSDREVLPNAVTSWRLLKKRQRWFRCLDAGYLSLKVFLLERFLHDILFESSSPEVLADFITSSDAVGRN